MFLTKRNILFFVITVVTVLYAEWFYPQSVINQCKWPSDAKDITNIVLIADPQLVDANTYPGRNRIASYFTRVVTDRFLARNYRMLRKTLNPEYVIFLGDLFDGGREWDDAEWKEEYKRMVLIFPRKEPLNPLMAIPGNHDVGSGESIVPGAFRRFKKHFGEANRVYQFGHNFLATLDTNVLMNDDSALNRGAEDYFNFMKENKNNISPLIILSHVPLARPEGADCGKLREGPPIKNQKGYQYTNMLTPELTQTILNEVEPHMLFSGDDHDYCDYEHVNDNGKKIHEYTVKSFSMAGGIKRPGFQVLSLETAGTSKTDLCLVHDPYWPMILQLLVIAALSGYAIAKVYMSQKPSQFKDDLPVSDTPIAKSQNRRRVNRQWSAVKETLIVVFIAFMIGQLIINHMSYLPGDF